MQLTDWELHAAQCACWGVSSSCHVPQLLIPSQAPQGPHLAQLRAGSLAAPLDARAVLPALLADEPHAVAALQAGAVGRKDGPADV